MRQRGRQVNDALLPTADFYKAEPPDYLTAEQKEVWQITVNRLGDEYFPAEVLPLLERYCCTVVVSRWLQGAISNNSLSGPERNKAMNDYKAFTALMLQLATKLRITTQSTRRENKGKPKVNAAPWQTADRET